MVATVFELKSSAVAVSYYERDGYYAKNDPEHRQASFWHGRAAKDLGLRAHVRPRRFEQVLSGYVPGTEIRLGRMREGEHEHRPGWDITFSAPKSVSLEALVVGDRRVIRAHDEAVRATLDWLEAELLETRGWDPARRRRPRVKADGMVVAGFRHLTSRDQDPQLHTHCVLANMTRNAAGEWRSVEPTKIRRSAKLIGAYYRNELARRLQALGMAVTPRLVGRVPGFELAGYDRSFLDAFSGRRREILAYIEEHGLAYTAEHAQTAALRTRRRKRDVGVAQLVPAWRARARALGLSREKAVLTPHRRVDPATGERMAVPGVRPPDLPANTIRSMKRAPTLPKLPRGGIASWGGRMPPAGPPVELSPEPEVGVLEAVGRAVAHVAERRTSIPEAEIRAVALGHAPGRYTLGEIDAAIDRLVKGGELIEVERRGMDRAFVTDRAVKAERRVLASMRAGRGKGMALAGEETVEERLAETGLTDGQKEAVRTVLLSDDLVIGVQGHAGSGKTTMLRQAKALLGNAPIYGLAPSAAAARVLEREAGMPAKTLQYFLTRFGDLSDPEALARAREDYAGSVLAVDEASMIDTARMDALLGTAARLGVARVALVGDTAQLRAVDAGQPFRLLQKAGMKTAAMTEVLRQRDPELHEAVLRSREGEPAAAIEGLGERVREAPREALGFEAARRWLALPPEDREDTLLLAPTHAIRRQANEAVREGLALEGTLHGRVLTIDRLVDRRLTRAQAAEISSYEPGDLAVFHRDHYGCRRDDVCTVTGIEDGMVVLAHPDGKERRFRPSGNAAWYLRICDTERIELRAGDRIRWTRNRRAPRSNAPDLVNGGEAEIVRIGQGRVRFRDAEGREFGLVLADPQLRHLDHAYCSTVHSAQGRTARAAIAVLEAGGAADRELFHVELSRASDAFLLLTDDREALAELLEAREGSEEGALEALGVDPAATPAVDPEVFATLAQDWRALQRRAGEANTLPFFLPGYRGVMARAAALSMIEDLPPDMRRLVDGMLSEHEGHLARDRQVRALIERIRESWRRWPELGWIARTRGCAVEELPGYARWREEGETLMEEARETLGEARPGAPAGDNETRSHLRAMPDGGVGLAGAVETLKRTRVMDDADRFGRLWGGLRERAARDGVPESLLPGYTEAAALGERLAAAAGLDDARQAVVRGWQEVHEAQKALAEAVRTLPDRVAAWRERRGDLPLDGHGGADPAHGACRAWREEGAGLGIAGVSMLRPGNPHAPYLDRVPGAAESVERAAEAVRDALAEDRYAGFAWLTRELERQSRETGTESYHLTRYGEAVAEARPLASQAGPGSVLSERSRATLESWLRYDEESARLCTEIRGWPGRADALRAECPEQPPDRGPGQAAQLDALAGWRDRAEALVSEGRAMRAEDGAHASHLAAMAGERKALEEALRGLDRVTVAAETREMDLLATLSRRWAEEAGGIAYDAPRYSALMERARALAARPGLPQDLRAEVDAHLARDERWAGNRKRVGAFVERAGNVLRTRNRLEERDVRESTPEWEGWLKAAREVRQEADAIGRDIPEAEVAAHLAALGAAPDGVAEPAGGIRSAIAEDERARAAAEAERRERARIAEESARLAEEVRIAEAIRIAEETRIAAEEERRARDRDEAPAEPVELLRETLNRARAAEGSRVAVSGLVPDADRDSVYRRLDGLRTAISNACLLLGDAPGFERIAAEWARDRGVEAFVFRPDDGAGPDAARERDRAIVESGPNLVIVYSDEEEPGFLARHAEERGIPVSVRPTAQLVRTADLSLDRDAGETQRQSIRKGPSIGF
ncbi:MAG: relaxase domain-containing protein [Acidobacteriota bacterium]|nr:relaxase domain-containing protein [Acidobacteriota bacterium]